MKNLYDILNVNKTSSSKDIKSAYKRLIRKYHPDKNNNPNSKYKFMEIQSAYEVLGNKQKRQEYDRMPNTDKMELYDLLNLFLQKVCPKYNELIGTLINNYYKDKTEFINDINTFNITNIFNKIYTKHIFNNNDIPIYNKLLHSKPYNLNIEGTIYTTLKDKYLNKYCKINVTKETTSITEEYIIPLNRSKVILKGKGERINNKYGDIIIKIICEDHSNYKQINDTDLIVKKTISLYEYIYGGSLTFKHLDDTIINISFDSCINNSII
jgi:DnaJ-class molecular chaperone